MRNLILLAIILIVPCSAIAESSIFSDSDNMSERKAESGFLDSFFSDSMQVAPRNPKPWGKFRSLEEYGLSPSSEEQREIDYSQIQAERDYIRSKNPFSDGNRLDQINRLNYEDQAKGY